MDAILKVELYEHKAYLTTATKQVICVFFYHERQPLMQILTDEEIKDLEALRHKYK